MKLCQSFVTPRRRSSNLVCSCFFLAIPGPCVPHGPKGWNLRQIDGGDAGRHKQRQNKVKLAMFKNNLLIHLPKKYAGSKALASTLGGAEKKSLAAIIKKWISRRNKD